MILKEERERKTEASKPIALTNVYYGHFCRDGSFSAENTPPGRGEIACDLNLRQVKLVMDQWTPEHDEDTMANALAEIFNAEFNPTGSAIYAPRQVTKLVESNSANAPFYIFLESSTPPVYEQQSYVSERKNIARRCSSLQGNHVMLPGCTVLCLAFSSRTDVRLFQERCLELGLPTMQKRDIVVRRRSCFSARNQTKLSDFLKSLKEFSLAFQVQKVVIEGVLEPLEVISLKEDILNLQNEYGDQAYALFQYFAETLIKSPRELLSRKRRRAARRRAHGKLHPPSLSQRLDEAICAYSAQRNQLPAFFITSRVFYLSYHLIITPSSYLLEGPLPDQSNSVLRRFEHHDSFLRVSFYDENRSRLRPDSTLSISTLVKSRFGSLLKTGLHLVGREYQFLGYSMSGLKDHSVWFVTPFQFQDQLMDARRIRRSLGDFTRIMYEPARLAARWSQAFSGTDPTVVLEASEIQHMPDRTSASGSVFTDGCGTISCELAQVAWSTLRSQRGHISGSRHVPSCFQIRLGGAKGVVVVDPTLVGRLIFLRPSQTKFDARNNRTLDIQSTSSRSRPFFLNRPMISILEYLGVKNESFIDLQEVAIRDVQSSRTSFLDASKLLSQHGLGASFRLPSLLTNIKSLLDLDLTGVSTSCLDHHLINESIRCARAHALREIKHRAHIPVPDSFTLLGVSDEWECLQEGEVYATVFDEQTGVSQPITGRVLLTRSPQIHPGDLQFAIAVRRPELSHLKNVIVFSCRGKRSLPSCLSGGDLDGDEYNLILNPTLHPPTIFRPAAYKSVPNKRNVTPCTIADIADFVTDYIESDLVGYIAILQLRYADLNGPNCKEYLDLAQFASHAVDYPKTGVPVNFKSLPPPPQSERPDFLSGEGSNRRLTDRFYRSQKVLGILFRGVLVDDHTADRHHGRIQPSDGLKIWVCLLQAQVDLGVPSDDLVEEMKYLLEAYSDRLFAIAQAYSLSKHVDSHLSEEELVSGTIMAHWADHNKRREALISMNVKAQQLTQAIRKEFVWVNDSDPEPADSEGWDSDESDDEELGREVKAETLKRAWAAWKAAEAALLDEPESFGPSSFGIIALGTILELVKKLRTR